MHVLSFSDTKRPLGLISSPGDFMLSRVMLATRLAASYWAAVHRVASVHVLSISSHFLKVGGTMISGRIGISTPDRAEAGAMPLARIAAMPPRKVRLVVMRPHPEKDGAGLGFSINALARLPSKLGLLLIF